MKNVLILLAVGAVASASPHGGTYRQDFETAVNPEEAGAAPAAAAAYPRIDNDYQFSYSVDDPATGDHKDQVENRNGGSVQGRYSLIEPDGLSRRVVDYSADDAAGFNAVVHNEPIAHAAPVAAAVRTDYVAAAQPVAIPAVRTEHVAVAAQPVAYPAVRTEHVAVAAQPVAYPAVRTAAVAAQPVAYRAYSTHFFGRAEPIAYPAAVQTHHVAYTPAARISYQPVVRTTAYVPPPAVSTQSQTTYSHTVHPQPAVYTNHVENVPVATPALRADHYVQTHVAAVPAPAVTHHVAAAAPVQYIK